MPDKTPEATPPIELRRSLLSLSEKHGVPALDLAALVLHLEDLSLLPLEVARRHVVLPVLVKDEALFLAMASPGDRRAIEEVEFVSGKKVHAFACDAEQLGATIDLAYERFAHGDAHLPGARATLTPTDLSADASEMAVTAMPSPPPAPSPHGPPGPAARPVPPPLPPALKSRSATLVQGQATVPAVAVTKPAEPGEPAALPPSIERTGMRPAFRTPLRTGRGEAAPRSSDAPVAPSVLPSALPPMMTPSGRTVAIVVGEASDRAVLRAAFADLGHLVVEIPRAEGALAAILERRPDLVVIDPLLPDGHGFDLCAELHAAEGSRGIRVLALVTDPRAWRLVDDLRGSYGVKGVLTRPIRAVEVLTRAEAALDDKPEPAPEDNLSPQAEVSLQSGMEAYQRGELDEAIRFIEDGLRAAPGSFRLHYHHGLLLGRTGAIHRAARALEQCVALHERYFPALRNLAVLYERAGFRRSALEAWERAHAAAPDDAARSQIKERVLSLL